MAEKKETQKKCLCTAITCRNTEELCHKSDCKTCKACCDSDCEGCEKKCAPGQKCKCYIPRCGCKEDCYKNGENADCKKKEPSNSCERCKVKCKDSDKCICYQCSCGSHCNGVICSCCSWCDPRNCSGGPCNGYVLGKCPEGKECQGHVKYDEQGNPVWDRNEYNSKCRKSHGDNCTNYCNRWATGVRDMNGNCVRFCKYCGTLCGQDKFRRCCYIAIPIVIIVLLFLIFRFMLPEKFQSMMTKIRAAFPTSPRRPSRSLSNLVGDKIPEEMNTDRYPAFRPRTYTGLS